MKLFVILVFCAAIPFAITLGIGAAMVICEWLYRLLPINKTRGRE